MKVKVKRRRAFKVGFTILELVISISILIILLATFVLMYRGHSALSAEGKAAEVSVFLNKARIDAITNIYHVAISFQPQAHHWNRLISFVDLDNDYQQDPDEDTLSVLYLKRGVEVTDILLYRIDGGVIEVDVNQFSGISYNPLGLVEFSNKDVVSYTLYVTSQVGGKPITFRVATSTGGATRLIPPR